MTDGSTSNPSDQIGRNRKDERDAVKSSTDFVTVKPKTGLNNFLG